MPSPEDLKRISGAISSDPAAFLPQLLSYIEKSVKECYDKNNEVSPCQATLPHLDNRIESDCTPSSESDTEMAKTKINQPVMIAGEKRWITASSMQEFADKVAKLLSTPQSAGRHPFGDYAWNWFHTFSKPNIETVTATTYERQIRLYLIPAFDGMDVEEITPDDVQRLFNHTQG